MARAEFLPKVNLFSSWEADNQTFTSRGGDNWAMGVTLNFNLFDGGAKTARLRESETHELQAQAIESQMASAVRLQVREAYLNLTTAQKRLEVVKDAKAHAAESLRIVQNCYESGLATIANLRGIALEISPIRGLNAAVVDELARCPERRPLANHDRRVDRWRALP